MSSILRQFRGLGIALAVLAISAGAVFAAAPSLRLASSTGTTNPAVNGQRSEDPSESAEPSASAEPSESARPAGSPASPLSPTAAATPSADTHGALVSTAAHMSTPAGFPNHGAFVSCVAHLDTSPTGFDWTTVTPQSCGIPAAASVLPNAGQGHGHGNGHGTNGHGHGATAH